MRDDKCPNSDKIFEKQTNKQTNKEIKKFFVSKSIIGTKFRIGVRVMIESSFVR